MPRPPNVPPTLPPGVTPPIPGGPILLGTTTEDLIKTGTITVPNNETINPGTFTTPDGATVTLLANGSYTYDPTGSQKLQGLDTGDPAEPDSFTFTTTKNGRITTYTANISVTGENDAPVAVDDTYTVEEDGSITFNPLLNDIDVDGDALTMVSKTIPNTIQNPDGTLTYTPPADFYGTTTFTYFARDGDLSKVSGTSATVTVNVTPVDDPPTPVDDSATTTEDTSVVIDAFANDPDPDGQENSLPPKVLLTAPEHGTATHTPGDPFTFTYTPDPNYSGQDTFTYTYGGSGTSATVTVNVTPVNDAPALTVPGTQQATPGPGIPITGVSIADPDANQTYTVTLTAPTNGAYITMRGGGVSGSGSNKITVTGTLDKVNASLATLAYDAEVAGTDTLSITVTDSEGGADTDVIAINVEAAPEPQHFAPAALGFVDDQWYGPGSYLGTTDLTQTPRHLNSPDTYQVLPYFDVGKLTQHTVGSAPAPHDYTLYTERRGVMEFDVSDWSGSLHEATLTYNDYAIATGSTVPLGSTIMMDVYAYTGTANDAIGLDDWQNNAVQVGTVEVPVATVAGVYNEVTVTVDLDEDALEPLLDDGMVGFSVRIGEDQPEAPLSAGSEGYILVFTSSLGHWDLALA